MKTHELKLDVKYFDKVKNGTKNFEIRKNDRDFKVGDILILKAFMPGLKIFVKWGEIIDPLNDDRMSHNYMSCAEKEADTIKVRVTWMLDTFENTNKWKAALKYLMDESNEKADDTAEKISEVLEQYFHTNQLPDGYVVLGTEVVK